MYLDEGDGHLTKGERGHYALLGCPLGQGDSPNLGCEASSGTEHRDVPSLSSTAQSLVEAFDPKGVLGHLRADLEPAEECISDLGHVVVACEGPPFVI